MKLRKYIFNNFYNLGADFIFYSLLIMGQIIVLVFHSRSGTLYALAIALSATWLRVNGSLNKHYSIFTYLREKLLKKGDQVIILDFFRGKKGHIMGTIIDDIEVSKKNLSEDNSRFFYFQDGTNKLVLLDDNTYCNVPDTRNIILK